MHSRCGGLLLLMLLVPHEYLAELSQSIKEQPLRGRDAHLSLSLSISLDLMQPNLYASNLPPNRHSEHLVTAPPYMFETSGITPVS